MDANADMADDSLYPKVPASKRTSSLVGDATDVTSTQKVVKTVFLVLTWVCLGLYLEITGPTLLDLKIRTQSNYEEVAFAVSGRSAGYFIGSALGGVLVDRFQNHYDLMIALCLNGGAVATVIAPWAGHVWALWTLCVCQGTFEGIINIAGQKLILEIWREKAASPLHILHGGFGIGSFIIPLIANPFLAVPNPRYNNNLSENASRISTTYNVTTTAKAFATSDSTTGISIPAYDIPHKFIDEEPEYLKTSRIEYAYIIAALITVALSSAFFVFHCKRPKNKFAPTKGTTHTDSKFGKCLKLVNPASCAEGRLWYGLAVFTFLFLHFFNCVGGERVGGKFIRAFAIEQLDFSTDNASFINTLFWLSFSGGRIAGFFAARWIPIRVLIVIECTGCFVTTILLNIFAHNNSLALWILTVPFGFFVAPLFPSGIGWGDHHIVMTGMGITTLLLGGSLGGIAYLRLIGYMFDTYGPRSFLYHMVGYGVVAVVLAIVLTLVGSLHGNRFDANKTDFEEVVDAQTEMVTIKGTEDGDDDKDQTLDED